MSPSECFSTTMSILSCKEVTSVRQPWGFNECVSFYKWLLPKFEMFLWLLPDQFGMRARMTELDECEESTDHSSVWHRHVSSTHDDTKYPLASSQIYLTQKPEYSSNEQMRLDSFRDVWDNCKPLDWCLALLVGSF